MGAEICYSGVVFVRKKCNFATTLTFGHFFFSSGREDFSFAFFSAAADSPFANQIFFAFSVLCSGYLDCVLIVLFLLSVLG